MDALASLGDIAAGKQATNDHCVQFLKAEREHLRMQFLKAECHDVLLDILAELWLQCSQTDYPQLSADNQCFVTGPPGNVQRLHVLNIGIHLHQTFPDSLLLLPGLSRARRCEKRGNQVSPATHARRHVPGQHKGLRASWNIALGSPLQAALGLSRFSLFGYPLSHH